MSELKIIWNPDVCWILGRPNFWCSGVASQLRKIGHFIRSGAENEQAYVIHWLLTLYSLYGEEFRDALEFDLQKAAKAPLPWTVSDQLLVDYARHRERRGG